MKYRHHYTLEVPSTFPTKEEWFAREYKFGRMLQPDQLIDGAFYLGECRNSNLAMWSKQGNRFIYVRSKFGDAYLEDIEHPEFEKYGHDCFIPHVSFSADNLLNYAKCSNYISFDNYEMYLEDTVTITENFMDYIKGMK